MKKKSVFISLLLMVIGVAPAIAGVTVKNLATTATIDNDVATQMPEVAGVPDVMNVVEPSAQVEMIKAEETAKTEQQLKIEKEREICLRNNIGVGNTFVWAARNSNVMNYSMMVEDVLVPENNTCFVKVGLNSADSKINLSDIQPRYFQMGQAVTCGSWVDEELLKKRILDAKKTSRKWGTVAAAVGGAAVGVGAMELFGNKMIGGAVQGQKALEGQELILSQLKALKKDNLSEYERVVDALRDLEMYCGNYSLWNGTERPQDCDGTQNNFIGLLDMLE